MPSVSGYQAGIEANDVELSYALEATWGVKPAVAFNALRYTGESLAGEKQRSRPSEINKKKQVSASVTQQESAGGGLNFALSYGTFDDLIACLLGDDWSAALAIDGVGGDIVAAATGNKLTSATAGKFAAVQVGQWIKLSGFTASAGANNGFYKVAAKASALELTLAGKTLINETPAGTAAKIRGSMIRNGTLTKSLFLQKKLSANMFLQYPGSIVSQLSLNGSTGNFFSGSFTFMSKVEQKALVEGSTGAIVAAPTGRFHDAVAGFGGVLIADTPVDAVVTSVALQVQREGAGADYGMGSASAQGMRNGSLTASGTIAMLFKSWNEYDRYKAESVQPVAWRTADADGAAYVFGLLGSVLTNPKIVAGGRDQPVSVEWTVEGNPDPTFDLTLQVDRFSAVA
ncbi:hypothetical protein BKE38_12095 [Pseudoroseomonas deserti]|uniref:Phage tail protein n=1 Tax=Teichococcus deserti TaxID=1817963 RepID=A0A1V2H2M4_9PROT|nr:phage tail tube protein [Pseudoroseomonas deserti]ONG53449.1 hypothetical protein BKE38_12095 [Pseudoroseomonas deserti]